MHRRLIMILATILALVLAAPVYAGPPDHAKGPNKDKKPKQSQPIEANDEYYELQWGPKQINAEEAWGTATGAGQVISIVDTGIDLDHPDLAGKIVGGRPSPAAPTPDRVETVTGSRAPPRPRRRVTTRTEPTLPVAPPPSRATASASPGWPRRPTCSL